MHSPTLLVGMFLVLLQCSSLTVSAAALSELPEDNGRNQPGSGSDLEYVLNKRSLYLQGPTGDLYPLDARERRANGADSSFVRFGRSGSDLEVSQPHTRSDIIIRFGRDGSSSGMAAHLNRLRQERNRRLARLAVLCAAKSQDDEPATSAEENILKEICRDAPLHPTLPGFV